MLTWTRPWVSSQPWQPYIGTLHSHLASRLHCSQSEAAATMGVERSTYLLVCSDAELCATFDKIMDRTIIDEDGHKLCTYAVNKVGTTRKLVMNQHGTIVSFEVDKGYPRLRLSPLSSASPLASVANGKGPMVFAHHVVYAWSHKNVRNTDEFKSRWLDPSLDISHLSARPGVWMLMTMCWNLQTTTATATLAMHSAI